MAKKGKREKIKLESSAGTGHFYTTRRTGRPRPTSSSSRSTTRSRASTSPTKRPSSSSAAALSPPRSKASASTSARRGLSGPEPDLLDRLLDEHPLAADRASAARARVAQQARLGRVVDGVEHDAPGAQRRGRHRATRRCGGRRCVVLTSTSQSSCAERVERARTLRRRAREPAPPLARASGSAPSRVAPRSWSANTAARAVPPAPSTTARFARRASSRARARGRRRANRCSSRPAGRRAASPCSRRRCGARSRPPRRDAPSPPACAGSRRRAAGGRGRARRRSRRRAARARRRRPRTRRRGRARRRRRCAWRASACAPPGAARSRTAPWPERSSRHGASPPPGERGSYSRLGGRTGWSAAWRVSRS